MDVAYVASMDLLKEWGIECKESGFQPFYFIVGVSICFPAWGQFCIYCKYSIDQKIWLERVTVDLVCSLRWQQFFGRLFYNGGFWTAEKFFAAIQQVTTGKNWWRIEFYDTLTVAACRNEEKKSCTQRLFLYTDVFFIAIYITWRDKKMEEKLVLGMPVNLEVYETQSIIAEKEKHRKCQTLNVASENDAFTILRGLFCIVNPVLNCCRFLPSE